MMATDIADQVFCRWKLLDVANITDDVCRLFHADSLKNVFGDGVVTGAYGKTSDF
jgi:hypothetical protein